MSVFGQIIFVSFIACAMSICAPAVAASQFAIYMSLSNLARSFGSYLFAQFAADLTVAQQFLTMALLLALAFSTMLFFRLDAHRERIRSTEASLPA
jgi:PAT family beta-lactamase induction signal transducer AmpG